MAPMGRQWFNLTFRDAGEMVRGVANASPALNAFLDAELKRHNLPGRALALVGFSQGTMMALGVGLKRHPAPAAIVGYSGALATTEALPKDFRLGAGDPARAWRMDEVIPVDAMFMAREQLARAGLAVEWHLAQGIGHGIDAEGLRLGGDFLRHAFLDLQRFAGEIGVLPQTGH